MPADDPTPARPETSERDGPRNAACHTSPTADAAADPPFPSAGTFPKSTEVLGRIAAQTAKQVIFQKVREAERENVFAEYNDRIGEVVSGTIKRFENGDIILELGRIEAVLPRKEQSRAESYAPGDRVRAVIRLVNRSAKGPQIVLSRTDPALLIKLFEQEVPEIYDGTVQIKGAVREAGDRAKVAVYSRERDVDPVGACVGLKGTRVQAIIRELRGEKIDIVEWSEDPVAFVTNAISPAKVQRLSVVDDVPRGSWKSSSRTSSCPARDRHTVIGTSRTADKLERARALGMEHGILVSREEPRFADEVRRLTGRRGAPLILDFVGGAYAAENLAALAPGGRVVVIGTMGGPKAALDLGLLMRARGSVVGPVLRPRPLDEKIRATQDFGRDVLPLVAAGRVRPVLDSALPMARAREAHERMERNESFGKLVLVP